MNKIIKDYANFLKKSIFLTLNDIKIRGIQEIKSELKKQNIFADVQGFIKNNKVSFSITQKSTTLDKNNKAVKDLQKTIGKIPIELLNEDSTKEISDKILSKVSKKIKKDFDKLLEKRLKTWKT
jgi:hypothetical protein